MSTTNTYTSLPTKLSLYPGLGQDDDTLVSTFEGLRSVPKNETQKCCRRLIEGREIRMVSAGVVCHWTLEGGKDEFRSLGRAILKETNRIRALFDVDGLANRYADESTVLGGRGLQSYEDKGGAGKLLSEMDQWMWRIPSPSDIDGEVVPPIETLEDIPAGLDLIEQTMAWSKILYTSRPEGTLPGSRTAYTALTWIGAYWGGVQAGIQFGGRQHLKVRPKEGDKFDYCARGEKVKATMEAYVEGRCVFVKGDERGIIVNFAIADRL